MNTEETNPEINPDIGIKAWYNRNGDTVFINSPCVFTEGKTLMLKEVYEIHDFTEPDVHSPLGDFLKWQKGCTLLFLLLRY